jgi:hypothetical protein
VSFVVITLDVASQLGFIFISLSIQSGNFLIRPRIRRNVTFVIGTE